MSEHEPPAPLDEAQMMALAERLETLPPDHLEWIFPLYLECQRARQAEARFLAGGVASHAKSIDAAADAANTAQLVLDAADWLRTLWEVGYMGSEALPAPPRSDFPHINVEDILKSALFARIRHGKSPLPFPPPTRCGMPWHEIVESTESFAVAAELVDDAWATIEACADWQVISVETPGQCYRVQHRGKGPLYQLTVDAQGAGCLRRLPAEQTRRIVRQSRANVATYVLEWPREDGGALNVPLRAAQWERAEAEAQRWIALRHSDLYGQIRFERCEV